MATVASDRLFGKSIKRREDPRFITGRGQYVDDLKLPGMTYAAFVRSPHAHAKIRKIDTAAALKVDREIPAAQRCPEPLRIEHLLPRLLGHFRLSRESLVAPYRLCERRGLVAFGLSRLARASGRVIGPLLGVGRSQASRLIRRGAEAWPAHGLTFTPS